MNHTQLSNVWFMDWRWRTGRKLADALHDAMEIPTAEVKCDGTVETLGTETTVFQRCSYRECNFRVTNL